MKLQRFCVRFHQHGLSSHNLMRCKHIWCGIHLREVVQVVCRTAAECFGEQVQLSLEVYRDPEIRDEYLTLYVRQENYDDEQLFNTIDEVSAGGCSSSSGTAAGLDFGLKTFLTGSDGTRYEAPQPLKASLTELKAANRALSRKKKGANHRAQAKLKMAKLHWKIRHQREAWHWKLARELCLKYDRLYD